MNPKLLIYDIEIVKAIPPRDGKRIEGVEYCRGWDDHASMGVACICAFDYVEMRYRVFTKGSFDQFEALAASRLVVGFNSISFDDSVCQHNGINVKTFYDLLREIWTAAGLPPTWQNIDHAGYGLDATAKANGLSGKTGHGAHAPVQWQRGEHGKVIDYCLEDIRQTKSLIDKVMDTGNLVNPKNPEKTLVLPKPLML